MDRARRARNRASPTATATPSTITELDPPSRFAYSADITTPDGQKFKTTVTASFDAIADDRCRVTMTHTGIPDAFIRSMVSQGWSAALEKLDAAVTS